MASTLTETTPRRAGLIAGFGYLSLFVFAIFGNFIVLESLVVSGDAAQTAANIAESESLFRLGIVAFLVIFALDVIVAWALYMLFEPYARRLSLLMAWFRIVYTVMLGVGAVFLLGAAVLAGNDIYASAFEASQVDAQIVFLLEAFDIAWMVGLAIFGLHLGLLGYLIVKTQIAPRLLGVALAIAGAAYVLDTTFFTILTDYEASADAFLVMVAVPSVIAELWMTVWLLARAGKEADPALPATEHRETGEMAHAR